MALHALSKEGILDYIFELAMLQHVDMMGVIRFNQSGKHHNAVLPLV